jgi:hypothetical protein
MERNDKMKKVLCTTMAIRNAGFGVNPKVSAFYTTRIAYIYE